MRRCLDANILFTAVHRAGKAAVFLCRPTAHMGHAPAKGRSTGFAAWAARVTLLLTADIKDLGQHMNWPLETDGVVIQTVAEFVASLGA